MKTHLLFLCSSNIDRSPAAEALFKDSEKFEARSAGVGPFCLDEKKVTKELVDWADEIFVMDERMQQHKTDLLKQVPEAEDKQIIILGVSNDYVRYDLELDEILRVKLEDYL
ncbi:protein tyrosine phosphatase [archaeon]|mgnify:FL=1|jgi:predicted protein tyrosine phosphatase|nr:protein tyrosine phosphatase [archaeon]MBT6606529.1 protein tyrosine phosphatase [archaeon]